MINGHIPIRCNLPIKDPPWITKNIKAIYNRHKRLRKKLSKNPACSITRDKCKIERSLNRQLKLAKANYESNLFKSKNSMLFFKYINNRISSKKNKMVNLFHNGEIIKAPSNALISLIIISVLLS